MREFIRRAALIGAVACAGAAAAPSAAQDYEPAEVPPLAAERPCDGFVINSAEATVANLGAHRVLIAGKPADGSRIGLWGWSKCSWEFRTEDPGDYVVSLYMVSGERRPGRFGWFAEGEDHMTDEFREKGNWTACSKAFKIHVPVGQTRTRMFVLGDGLYLTRVDLSHVTQPVGDGAVKVLAESSYRTTLRRAEKSDAAGACVVLVPDSPEEAAAAKALAEKWKLPTLPEPQLEKPFPAPPRLAGLGPDTNLLLVSSGRGGPLTQALRRAQLVMEDECAPGPGGYVIRTIPRPFTSRANVIVISSSDAKGLLAGVDAFAPKVDAKTGELAYDTFLVDAPSKRWGALRNYRYRVGKDEAWWKKRDDELAKPMAGIGGGRGYIRATAEWGEWYWLTGNPRFADLFKRWLFKMQDEDIYGNEAKGGESHMELYGLMRAWDLCEEAPAFSDAERLRGVNYLLRCIEGREGFPRAYAVYDEYAGKVGMKHNHQTILGCGMMQAYLYYSRLYGLGRAGAWKEWCDDVVANGTRWGHAPEDSANYEPRSFIGVADMIRCQGLSTKGVPGTEKWPDAALRFAAGRDSFSLPSAYGDCSNMRDEEAMRFFEILGEDRDWPAAQFLMDRLIRGCRAVAPKSPPTTDLYAWVHGSADVGGVRKPPDRAAALDALKPLAGLAALPMTNGYYDYMSGRISNPGFWSKHPRPDNPPYETTADKLQFRSGWETGDAYVLIDALGWADYGHYDLGAIVQFCQGGRLWIVDGGYNNVEARHHSTLEVSRDGVEAWGLYEGEKGRGGDFRAGPQMFEIVALDPPAPGNTERFAVTCRARNLAGATWLRTVSGGKDQPLVIEDTLTADEPGEYKLAFRLRLLGAVEGAGGKWLVRQKDASLPVALDVAPNDAVAIAPWEPDDHAQDQGRYPWYPFISDDGRPKTLELTRTVKLAKGEKTTLRATLGPAEK